MGPLEPDPRECRSADREQDQQFRHRVLAAYEYRCAVCGFNVRLGTVPIAPDAAHIRWHHAGGPALESIGSALCVLHHKTFDLGVFTLNHEGALLVSDQANGIVEFSALRENPPPRASRGRQRAAV